MVSKTPGGCLLDQVPRVRDGVAEAVDRRHGAVAGVTALPVAATYVQSSDEEEESRGRSHAENDDDSTGLELASE